MVLSPWWLLLAAVPVLLLGEFLVRKIPLLAKVHLPAPVVGGFVIALIVLAINIFHGQLTLVDKVGAKGWTWLTSAEIDWGKRSDYIYRPFNTIFFTCVGLNASWLVARRGSWMLLWLLTIATAFAVMQNLLGVSLARMMGQSPLLGLVCGSVTLTGGPSTALAFAGAFEKNGFAAAGVVGAAAAMFGIITGSIFAGPLAGTLIRRRRMHTPKMDEILAGEKIEVENDFAHTSIRAGAPTVAAAESAGSLGVAVLEDDGPVAKVDDDEPVQSIPRGFFNQLKEFASLGNAALIHLVVVLACIKIGAWIGYGMNRARLQLPVYMGALLCGLIVRNVLDLSGKRVINTYIVNVIASLSLAIFLVIAMSSLNLMALHDLAGAMLIILSAQVVMMLLFAYFVTFNLLGRDYDAAITSGGHVGFGLGMTPNAVATIDALTTKFGPSPRALLIVTTVGAFLIDLTNNVIVTVWMNLLK